MDPEIKILPPKKLIGMSIDTSLTEYGAPGLWQRFMPRVKSIENKVGSEKYSIQIYDNLFSYSDFHPKLIFKYWAATEVQSFESVPKEMEALELPGGKYAVFTHKGTMAGFQKNLNWITDLILKYLTTDISGQTIPSQLKKFGFRLNRSITIFYPETSHFLWEKSLLLFHQNILH